ncbi:MAG: right-handed parallel beta-helix repeat-containing protein [Candidatus Hydrogenedentota bacterium]
MRFHIVVALITGLSFAAIAAAAQDHADPARVAAVLDGAESTANAAWWGFEPEDSTALLQAAIDSGAETVRIPFMSVPWIVTGLELRSNQTIVLEPGVVILAKEGAFKGKSDCLVNARLVENVRIVGTGATLRMRKADYQTDGYEPAEWRHTLSLRGVRNVVVDGLRLESSGGDGIYFGTGGEKRPYCENVTVKNVVCHDHHRQGMSVITARDLLIEDCILSDTDGTAPEAGIDVEPNRASEKLENVRIEDCIFRNNTGAAMQVYVKPLSVETAPIEVTFARCHVENNRGPGIRVGAVPAGTRGYIRYEDCTIENTQRQGAYIYDKAADGARVTIATCSFANVGAASDSVIPLHLVVRRTEIAPTLGGVAFENVRIYDDAARHAIKVVGKPDTPAPRAITGDISVCNPEGVSTDLGNLTGAEPLAVTPMATGCP